MVGSEKEAKTIKLSMEVSNQEDDNLVVSSRGDVCLVDTEPKPAFMTLNTSQLERLMGTSSKITVKLNLSNRISIPSEKFVDKFIEMSREGYASLIQSLPILESDSFDFKSKSADGRTAFMVACEDGHLVAVSYLLHLALEHPKKIDLWMKDENKQSGFHLACRNGHSDIVNLILKLSKNATFEEPFNEVDVDNDTPLLTACKKQRGKVIKVLTDHPELIDFNAKTTSGQTAFHIACHLQNNFIVDQLVKTALRTSINLKFIKRYPKINIDKDNCKFIGRINSIPL